jgi:hypothetical protein
MTGPAAARLTFWPEIGVPDIGISCRTFRPIQRGFTITRERIPEELVMDVAGCRVTVPALTALDLVSSVGGEGIDRVLRLRLASLDDGRGSPPDT